MRRLATVGCAAALLAGCGGEAGDVLAIEVSGAPGGGDHTLVVSEDGRARCDGGELEAIESAQLIEARDVARELEELDEAELRLPAAGGRAYVARVPDATARWSERSPGKPEALARAELLALELGRALCP